MTKNDDNLSGAFALDAVTEAERAAFAITLRDSEELRNETTELQDTAVILGLAVDPVVPSPALRAALLAQVALTPQLPREDAVATSPALVKAEARWFRRPVVAIASMAAAIALIAGGISVGSQILSPPPSIQAQQLSAIELASDKQELVADVTGGGTATLKWSQQLASSAIVVEGVEALPISKVYQLWYIDAAGARSAGFLTVDADGAKSWQVLAGTMNPGDTIGVTVEPEGGSETPSTDPVVVIPTAA